MTAFDQLTATMFSNEDVSVPASYLPRTGGLPQPVRILLVTPDPVLGFGDGAVMGRPLLIEVPEASVPAPAGGDRFEFGDGPTVRIVQGEPEYQHQTKVWRLDTRPG